MPFFILIMVWLITILGVFSRGLYFNSTFYPVHLLILILFIVFLLRVIMYKEKQIKPFVGFVFIPLFYLIGFLFGPASKLLSMTTFFRSTSYLAIFLMLYWALKINKKFIDRVPYLIQTIGLLIAGQMLLAQMGMLGSDSTILNRYAGIFEYPNTFGLVMATLFVFSLLTAIDQVTVSNKLFFLFPLPVYLVMLLGSNSRGVMLLLPVVLFIALIIIMLKKQVYLLVVSIMSIVFAIILSYFLSSERYILTIIFMVAFSAILFLIDRLVNRIPESAQTRKLTRYVIPISLITIGLIFVIDFLTEGYIYQSLPVNIQERINHFGEISTFRERGLFLKDGLRMSREHLLFGKGGRTWEMNYRNAQSLPYQSNESHNGYLEMILDIGWGGFIIFFSLLVPFIIQVIKGYHKKLTKFIIPILLMVLHSLIDFNFSFGLVWLILFWFVAALLANIELNPIPKHIDVRFVYPVVMVFMLIFSLITIFYSYRFIQADDYFEKYEQTGDLTLLVTAEKLNPYDPSIGLSRFEEKLNRNVMDEQEVIGEVDTLIKLAPTYSRHLSEVGLRLNAYGYREHAYQIFHKVLSRDKLETRLYEVTSDLSLRLYRQTDDKKYLEDNINLFEQGLKTYQEKTSHPYFHGHNSRDFMLAENWLESVGLTYFLLGELDQLIVLLDYLPADHELYHEIEAYQETKQTQQLNHFFTEKWNQY